MEKPSRRKLLSSIALSGAIGSAGCLQALSTSVRTPNVAIGDIKLPKELERYFQLEVSVLNQFSEGNPAQIRISFRHRESTDAPRTVQFGESSPFSYYNGGKLGEIGTYLIAIPEGTKVLEAIGATSLDANEWVPDSPTDGCWSTPGIPRAEKKPRNPVELSPGDRVSQNYHLLGFDQEDCLSDGTYRFRSYEPYTVSQAGEAVWQNQYGEEWVMEFTLQLSK